MSETTTRRVMPLRPGLLVKLSTRLTGGVEYTREDLGEEIVGSSELSSWKTEKKIENVEEHRLAVKTQGRYRSIIKGVCVSTSFGLICLTEHEDKLYEKIAEAEALRDTFNETAVLSKVHGTCLVGRIEENSRHAVAAVREEIRTLLGELNGALSAGNVQNIRDVAARATQMGRLLEQDTEARNALERAVKESRRVATELVKRIEDGADAVAEVLSGANVSLISMARHTFSEDELGEIEDGEVATLPSVSLGQHAGLDEEYVELPPAPEPEPAAPAEPEAEELPQEVQQEVEAEAAAQEEEPAEEPEPAAEEEPEDYDDEEEIG